MFGADIIEKLGHYVYRLIDPRNGETFYVGKGLGNRVFQHAQGLSDGAEDEAASNKLARIRAIQLAGFEVAHVIHRHGLDGATAYQVEAALMEAYPGLTNIMGGHHSDALGVMHAEEIRRRYESSVAKFRHRVVMVTVNKLAAEESLYEATRYAWRIDVRRAEKAEYILPVVSGIIRGAFVAERWLPATPDNFPGREPLEGRWGFEGRAAPDEIVSFYAQHRVPESFRKKGAVSPVKYAEPTRAT